MAMTAEAFAALLHGRRTGRGKWMAKCPSHPDRNPSLSIAEGKRSPVVFQCKSAGCSQKAILDAVGLTWKDVLGERIVSPEVRQRIRDEKWLAKLEHRHGWLLMAHAVEKQKRAYWQAGIRNVEKEIAAIRMKLYPERETERLRREKMDAAIRKYGMDVIWAKFLATEQGKQVHAQYTAATPLPPTTYVEPPVVVSPLWEKR